MAMLPLCIFHLEKTLYGTLIIKVLGESAFRSPTFQELYDKTQQFQIGGAFNLRGISI